MSQIYRMDDRPDAASRPAIACSLDEAKSWNTPERGHGVFVTVNDFRGARRKENLARIRAWPIDIDDGTKAQMHAKLIASPLVPSLIVETKRGYQAYWFAREGATAEHWNAIVLERLVPHYGADKNARDLCRILRVANTWHLKDPTEPFRCRSVWQHDVSYSERQIGEAFRWVPNMDEHRRHFDDAKRAAERIARERQAAADVAAGNVPTQSLWDAVGDLNAMDTLQRLSGTGYVNGEVYTFRRQTNGNYNIHVDGKGSAAFIDANGKIGSSKGGGPTPAQWLRYFGHPTEYIVEALLWAHPHLVEIDAAGRAAWVAAKRAA